MHYFFQLHVDYIAHEVLTPLQNQTNGRISNVDLLFPHFDYVVVEIICLFNIGSLFMAEFFSTLSNAYCVQFDNVATC